MSTHTLGWMNRATKDGRILTGLNMRDRPPPWPVYWRGELAGTMTAAYHGEVWSRIECDIDWFVDEPDWDRHALGLDLAPVWTGPLAVGRPMNISGSIAGAHVIAIDEWAWDDGDDE